MNARIVKSLVKKDVTLFFKNKFFAAITILGLVAYIIIYFSMPKTVDDKISLGIFANTDINKVLYVLETEDVTVTKANSIEELKKLVLDKSVIAGIAFPKDFSQNNSGIEPTITIYFPSDTEKELKEAIEYTAKELAFTEFGYGLNIESKSEVLGPEAASIGVLLGIFLNDFATLLSFWKVGGIVLFFPTLVYLFPKIPEVIAKFFPTYYLLQPIIDLSEKNASFSTVSMNLVILIGINIALVLIVILAANKKKDFL